MRHAFSFYGISWRQYEPVKECCTGILYFANLKQNNAFGEGLRHPTEVEYMAHPHSPFANAGTN